MKKLHMTVSWEILFGAITKVVSLILKRKSRFYNQLIYFFEEYRIMFRFLFFC